MPGAYRSMEGYAAVHRWCDDRLEQTLRLAPTRRRTGAVALARRDIRARRSSDCHAA